MKRKCNKSLSAHQSEAPHPIEHPKQQRTSYPSKISHNKKSNPTSHNRRQETPSMKHNEQKEADIRSDPEFQNKTAQGYAIKFIQERIRLIEPDQTIKP